MRNSLRVEGEILVAEHVPEHNLLSVGYLFAEIDLELVIVVLLLFSQPLLILMQFLLERGNLSIQSGSFELLLVLVPALPILVSKHFLITVGCSLFLLLFQFLQFHLLDDVVLAFLSDLNTEEGLLELGKCTLDIPCFVSWHDLEALVGHSISY